MNSRRWIGAVLGMAAMTSFAAESGGGESKGVAAPLAETGKIIAWPRIRGGNAANVIMQRAAGRCMALGIAREHQEEVSSWTDIIVAESGYDHVMGLKADGTVVAAGSPSAFVDKMGDWNDIVAIAPGRYHNLGLKSDGTVVAVGSPNLVNVQDWKDIVAIGAGHDVSIGVRKDGVCVAVGNKNIVEDVSGWKDIVAVAAGHAHVLGLKTDGTVVATRPQRIGQCDVQAWRNVIDIHCCNAQSVGLCADGSLVYAGRDDYRESEATDWKDIIAVGVSELNVYGVKSDGSVVLTAGKVGKGAIKLLSGLNVGATADNKSPRVPTGRDIRSPWPPKDWKPKPALPVRTFPTLPPPPPVPAPQSKLMIGRPMIALTTYSLNRADLAVGLKTGASGFSVGNVIG